MSKGIYIRISDEAHKRLSEYAKERGITVYRLVKELLEEYAKGKLKLITPEEEALLKMRLKIAPIKERMEKLEKIIKEIQNDILMSKQIIDQVIVLEQRINSLEKRIRNLERGYKTKVTRST
ncbi:MAG: hypothetical protein ACTSYM_13555 [Candidatus Baldrarchaeia archaeon]